MRVWVLPLVCETRRNHTARNEVKVKVIMKVPPAARRGPGADQSRYVSWGVGESFVGGSSRAPHPSPCGMSCGHTRWSLCTGVHTHTHTHSHTHTHTHTSAYIDTYIHTYIHTYIRTCMHACMHTYMHVMHICPHLSIYLPMYL